MKNLSRLLVATLLALPALHAASEAPAKSAAPEAGAAIPYTRSTCIVSDEGLGEMGAPITYIHKEEGKPDRVIKFCCKSCVGKFKKDPAKYLAKLDAPAAAEDHAAHAGHAH